MIFFIAFVGAITPGPDILLVLRETLKNGFFAGFKTLCGIATGWIIYISILYFGFAHLVSGDLAQFVLSLAGGIYLLYLSFLLFRTKMSNIDFSPQAALKLDSASSTQKANSSIVDEISQLCEVSDKDRTDSSSRKRNERNCEKSPQDDEFALDSANLYLKGLIINLSNPKAILFFTAIVAPYIDKSPALYFTLLFLGLNAGFLSVMSVAHFARRLITNRLFYIIDKVCAVVFLAFGGGLLALSVEKWGAL